MSAAEVLTVKQAELITNLFLAGHGLDFICERGVTGAVRWTRPLVLELVRRQEWELDGSGRVPRSQRPVPPRPAPPARPRRPAEGALEAIAQWGDKPRPTAVPARVETKPNAVVRPPSPAPTPSDAAATPHKGAAIPTDLFEAVTRFLAERTIEAPADQFITSPDLRDAYETWAAETAAPAVTPRWFGLALTSRYRKKQSVKVINGTKPVCYYGIALKPDTPEPTRAAGPAAPTSEPFPTCCPGGWDVYPGACPQHGAQVPSDLLDVVLLGDEPQTPTEGTAPEASVSDAAGTAPDPSGPGHGIAGPDAQPQVSPSRSHAGKDGGPGASDAPAAPPVTDVVEFTAEPSPHQANAAAPAADPGGGEAGPRPVTSVGMRSHQVDLLAVGLAHPDPKIRAKAARVHAVIDDLCRALARRRA